MSAMNWAPIAATFVGLVITIVGIVLGWYVFPGIIEDEVAENVILNNNTDQFGRFETLPIPLDFKVYIFHITNEAEVNNGAKPIVEEKGPYVYKQAREKTNMTWSGSEISYYEYLNFEFDQAASGKLKKDDTIVVLDPAINSAAQIMEMTSLSFLLPLLSLKAEEAFGHPGVFVTTTVQEFLFDGTHICNLGPLEATPGNPTPTIDMQLLGACIGLYFMPAKNIRPNINEKGESELIFSFVNHKNITHDGHYTVNSGARDFKSVGWIKRWEDKEYLPFWEGGKDSKCNKVQGRDAVLYQPYLTDDTVITVFNTDICRTVDLHYTKQMTFRDATAYEYQLQADILKPATEDNGEMCYCLNTTEGITQENGCMKLGLREIFTCYNAPILLSFPHFLWADDAYKNAVQGISADEEKHRTFAVLEPTTGTPLSGAKRVQFNMFVRKIDGVKFLEGFKETRLIPILWLDEGFEINDDLYGDLYDMYISKTYLITGVTWGVISLGLAVIVITLVVFVVLKRRSKEVV